MQSVLSAALVLQRLPELGPATYWRLLDSFSSPDQILSQPVELLRSLLKPAACEALAAYQQNPETSAVGQSLMRDLEWLDQQTDVTLLGFEDPHYPELLRQIRKPPPLLYVRGDASCLSLPQIAVVGSRNPTAGGKENAANFARFLASTGFAITSGLALGVDGAAHQGALAAKGKTLAVLGTGIDRVYPSRHRTLAQDIVANGGALVTEFPLGTGSLAGNFPQRNRIISGLSCGTLVVEAAVQSGSLITARLALEQNREVFAIPGSIHNPLARGCHSLIRQGAKLVETGQDIVEELGGLLAYQQEQLSCKDHNNGAANNVIINNPDLSDSEQQLLEHVGFDLVDIDTLCQRSQLPIGSLMAQLVALELKGLIHASPMGYTRVS